MDIKELKRKLTVEQILQLMNKLGADSKKSSNPNEIIFRTICHCGHSHKLYFYLDSHEFYCYSNCGSLDIITIVQNVKRLSITNAIGFICNEFGLGDFSMDEGFVDYNYGADWDLLSDPVVENKDFTREFNVIDDSVLNMFYRYYHPCFYEDGISIATLRKYEIRYDILEQRVIIPHRLETGELIAIRCRNLRQDLLDEKKKYMPIVLDKKLLSAHTTKYLFGLYFNKENIKNLKKVILVESEKAVMQLDTILDNNIGVALSSSSLSLIQVELLKELGVEEVVVALDKEYHEFDTLEEKQYAVKIRKGVINKLLPYFNVSVVWDKVGALGYKDSPTDKGREVFISLYNDRIRI